jgi:hypothetical protein
MRPARPASCIRSTGSENVAPQPSPCWMDGNKGSRVYTED